MQDHHAKHTLAASHHDLDAKLELLQQLGYDSRFFDEDEDVEPISDKSPYLDHDTHRWVQDEYNWALEEAADAAAGIPDLFDVEEEDEELCLPCVYDPTFFASRPSATPSPRTRAQSLTQPARSNYEKVSPHSVSSGVLYSRLSTRASHQARCRFALSVRAAPRSQPDALLALTHHGRLRIHQMMRANFWLLDAVVGVSALKSQAERSRVSAHMARGIPRDSSACPDWDRPRAVGRVLSVQRWHGPRSRSLSALVGDGDGKCGRGRVAPRTYSPPPRARRANLFGCDPPRHSE
ncbi:hypothetical protein BD413DRAFT_199751 [Trametes elegans]|nr:hypothetical protein BD413DRAFT_199751 [Trametes elegans]